MSTWVYIVVIVLLFLIFPKGRKVFHIGLAVIYIPMQHLFMWLQKVNLSLKDKDPLLFYLSCIVIYPLYAIIIPFSKLYESFHNSMH